MSGQSTKAAAELRPGDRIAEGFLPLGDAATVLFVEAYTSRRTGDAWVFVVHRTDGYGPESDVLTAAARIPVELVDTGLTYTRADTEDDDPRPVSPARVPLHTGSVVSGGRLVVDGQ